MNLDLDLDYFKPHRLHVSSLQFVHLVTHLCACNMITVWAVMLWVSRSIHGMKRD